MSTLIFRFCSIIAHVVSYKADTNVFKLFLQSFLRSRRAFGRGGFCVLDLLIHKGENMSGSQGDLLALRDCRLAVAVLRAVHSEVGVAAAFDYYLGEV